jgi:hypothetical protein
MQAGLALRRSADNNTRGPGLAGRSVAAWHFDLMASFEDCGTELPPALRARAQKLLLEGFGLPTLVTKNWQRFGDEHGNQIELLSSPDGSCELWVRIDARTDAESFLVCLVVFIIEMECELYAPEFDRRFPGQMILIKEALQASDAWRFALGAR